MSGKSDQPNIKDLIEKLKLSLQHEREHMPLEPKGVAFPKASVAVILRPNYRLNYLQVLLIKRKIRESDPWSGQMAFPGGRSSKSDKNPLSTAIREVMEETGLDLRDFSILGVLDDVVPGNVSIRVTPFVALSKEEASVKIEPREVESFVWIPLSFFSDKKNKRSYLISRLGQQLEVPSYRFAGQVIWGLTLRIIEDLITRIQ